jgi:hypothetical protein
MGEYYPQMDDVDTVLFVGTVRCSARVAAEESEIMRLTPFLGPLVSVESFIGNGGVNGSERRFSEAMVFLILVHLEGRLFFRIIGTSNAANNALPISVDN